MHLYVFNIKKNYKIVYSSRFCLISALDGPPYPLFLKKIFQNINIRVILMKEQTHFS